MPHHDFHYVRHFFKFCPPRVSPLIWKMGGQIVYLQYNRTFKGGQMALHTQAEFCRLLGITKDYLKSYKKRGKIILTDGKYIDDANEINAAFVATRKPKEELLAKKEVKKTDVVVKPNEDEGKNTEPNTENTDVSDVSSSGMSAKDLKTQTYNHLIIEEKAEKILKTREEREVTRLKKEKMLGESLPIEPIKRLILLLSEAIFSVSEQEFENFIIMFGAQQGLNRTEMANMRADAMDKMNKARIKAVEEAKKGVRKIQIEYSAKKGRGERQ